MFLFKKTKTDDHIKGQTVDAVTSVDCSKLPKPSKDILFDVDGSSLVLEKKFQESESAWVVAYSRMEGAYLTQSGVRITEPVICMEHLVSLGRLLDAEADLSRSRICLYFPGNDHCYYLKHHCYTDEDYEERAQYILPLKDASEDRTCSMTTYLSESGLLSLAKAESYFAPRGKIFLVPQDMDEAGTVDLRPYAQVPEDAPVFLGLYDSSERSMRVFTSEDGKADLHLLRDAVDLTAYDPARRYSLCLIRPFSEGTCSYLHMCAAYDPESATGVTPLVLEHRYDCLLAPPLPLSDQYYATLRHASNGRVILSFIPNEEIFKYHSNLLETEMPAVDDPGMLVRFDPDDEEVTPDSFKAYILQCAEFFKSHGLPDADLLRAKKRVLYNVSQMLLAAVKTKGLYEDDPEPHEDIWPVLSQLMAAYEDDLILNAETRRDMKMFLLQAKYARPCDMQERSRDIRYYYDDTMLLKLSRALLRIEIIEIRDQMLTVEGCLKLPAVVRKEDLELYCFVNDVLTPYTAVERYVDENIFGQPYQTTDGFRLQLPLDENSYKISFGIGGPHTVALCQNLEFSQTSPLSRALKNAYYYQDGYAVKAPGSYLLCLPCDEEKRLYYEDNLRTEIERRAGDGAERILALREYYWDHKDDQTEDIWLMLDRADRADDNAEVLFRYVAGQAFDHVKPVFILSSSSPQFEELSEVGTVYDFHSDDHQKAFLISSYIFSSQFSPSTINPFNEDLLYFRDISRQKKFVFLQHGVTKDDNGLGFSHYARNFYGIIVSGNEEYDYMCRKELANDPETIWLTGMPRFDRVYDHDQRIITIMPTWRKYLTNRVFDEEQQTMIWQVKDSYKESEYFNFYNSLINDERLIEAARKKHYTIQLMPHVQFLKQADDFEIRYPDVVSLCHYDTRYCDVFSKSSLILTDFSSIGFDFGYLHKPVVYCQFDKEAFYQNHTMKPGYFDYEPNGFGEVLYNLPDTIETLISYIENDCKMRDLYRQRVDAFFKYTDHNCCERICRRVFELEKRESDVQ